MPENNFNRLNSGRKNTPSDEISGDVDLSSLRGEDYSPEIAEDPEIEIEVEDIPEELPADEVSEEDIDFIYGEDDSYDYSGSLENISADSISLESIDDGIKIEEMRNPRKAVSMSLKNQIMADDLAMDMGGQPKLNEMSDEYGNTKKKEEEILNKDKLDREEKELIKNRLRFEIESKPEGFNQRKSLEMYHKLMDEQREKEARHGLLMVLVLSAIGLISAVSCYFIKINADGTKGYMDFLPLATASFSLLIIIRAKAFRIFAIIYFIVYTVVLIWPGLIPFAMAPENQGGPEYLIKLGLFAASIICGAIVCIQLITSKPVEAYYSYTKPKNNRRR